MTQPNGPKFTAGLWRLIPVLILASVVLVGLATVSVEGSQTRDRSVPNGLAETPAIVDVDSRDQLFAISDGGGVANEDRSLAEPPGFNVTVFSNVSALGGTDEFSPGPSPGPRVIRFYNGTLYVTIPDRGADTDYLVALPDDDNDGTADRVVTVLESPEISDAHGFDFHDGHLYVVNHDNVFPRDQNTIVRYEMSGLTPIVSSATVLNDTLPERGDFFHWTRTLEVHEGHIYVTVGSESNVDPPSGGWYAGMTRCDLDGSNCEVIAKGLRNAVGFTFHDGTLFASDNGRDNLNDSAPPDEINFVDEGDHFGWPYCYGDNTPDPRYNNESRCEDKTTPVIELRAHSVPLGIDFYTAKRFPKEYQGDLYVAMHGSHSADPARGYKVVRIPYENGQLDEPVDFITGWYESDGDGDLYEKGEDIFGRPADVTVGPDGAMYISDDSDGTIYRVPPTNALPNGTFQVSPRDPIVDEATTFDAANSSDQEGPIALYEWDFDNDGTIDSTGSEVQHSFDSSGMHNVTLKVTDGDGATDTVTRTIEVRNVLTIEGADSSANYELEVDGNLSKSSAYGASVNPGDSVDGKNASGYVIGGRDSYSFSGDVVRLAADSGVNVYLDGTQVDPTSVVARHTIVLRSANQSSVNYEFETTANLSQVGVVGASVDSGDSVDDNTATGYVVGGRDSFTFSGDLQAFAADGDPIVVLDGSRISPADRVLNHTITIRSADGTGTKYTLEVGRDLEKSDALGASINPGDSLSGTQASGFVIGGRDSYEYRGNLDRFSATGDLIVYLDGQQVEPSELVTTHTITISSESGTAAVYEFEVDDNLSKSSALGASINEGDVLSGENSSGYVIGGQDSFTYDGGLVRFASRGAVDVVLDGAQVEPATRVDIHTITIESVDGSAVEYEFEVGPNLTKSSALGASVNEGDEINGTTASGYVIQGLDSYTHTDNLTSFTATGDVFVYRDGNETLRP